MNLRGTALNGDSFHLYIKGGLRVIFRYKYQPLIPAIMAKIVVGAKIKVSPSLCILYYNLLIMEGGSHLFKIRICPLHHISNPHPPPTPTSQFPSISTLLSFRQMKSVSSTHQIKSGLGTYLQRVLRSCSLMTFEQRPHAVALVPGSPSLHRTMSISAKHVASLLAAH